MKRVWHPYWAWEDYIAGMWRIVPKSEASAFLAKAITFTGDHELYGSFMQRVIVEWPVSCEQNFTAQGINKRAWVGHAACCLAIQCPEYITRQAWRELTQEQRDLADAQAERAIVQWKKSYAAKDQSVHQDVGDERLSGGYSRRSRFHFRIPQQGRLFPDDLLGDYPQ